MPKPPKTAQADVTRVAPRSKPQRTVKARQEGFQPSLPESPLQRMYESLADFGPGSSELRAVKEGDPLGIALSMVPLARLRKLRAIAKEHGAFTRMVAGELHVGFPYTQAENVISPRARDFARSTGTEWIKVKNLDELNEALGYGDGGEEAAAAIRKTQQAVPETGSLIEHVATGDFPKPAASKTKEFMDAFVRSGQRTFRPDSLVAKGAEKLLGEQDLMKRMKEMQRRLDAGEELKDIKPKRKLPRPMTKGEKEFRDDLKGVEGTPKPKKLKPDSAETLVGVAIRKADGTVRSKEGFYGGHAGLDQDRYKAGSIPGSKKGETDGFITSTGRFVDRLEALKIMRARHARKKFIDEKGLLSEDMPKEHFSFRPDKLKPKQNFAPDEGDPVFEVEEPFDIIDFNLKQAKDFSLKQANDMYGMTDELTPSIAFKKSLGPAILGASMRKLKERITKADSATAARKKSTS